MIDYTSRRIFENAIRSENAEAVQKCLQAGQVLDFPFLCRIMQRGIGPVSTILTFKKHVDLNLTDRSGNNWLWYMSFRPHVKKCHLMIQAGIDVSHQNHEGKTMFSEIAGFYSKSIRYDETRLTIMLMILSVGGYPSDLHNINLDSESRSRLCGQVQKWLEGLATAKTILQKIFDNKNLEKELCDFIFTEKYLR